MTDCRICREDHAPGAWCEPISERVARYVEAAKAEIRPTRAPDERPNHEPTVALSRPIEEGMTP